MTLSALGVNRGGPEGPSLPPPPATDKKISNSSSPDCFFFKPKVHQKSKTRFQPGLRRTWLGGLRRSRRPPSRLERGKPPPHSPAPRRLRRLELGASVLRPPQHKILATPVVISVTVFSSLPAGSLKAEFQTTYGKIHLIVHTGGEWRARLGG